MNHLTLVVDYKNEEKYRLSFNALAKQIYGIDFEPWFRKGFWNNRYIPYSYAEGDKVISNVSINKMDLIWEGQKKKALQIGTVMTSPDYRNQGLASSLLKKVLAENEADYDFIYLYGNNNALSLYIKFGFEPIKESTFYANLSDFKLSPAALRKLDTSNPKDLDLIFTLGLNRTYVSESLGATNDEALIMFYSLYVLSDHIYYLEKKNTIVMFEVKGTELHLYDIISKRDISVEEVLSKIASPQTDKVVFHFTPRLKSLEVKSEDLQKNDCTLLIKPLPQNITNRFLFPITSHA